MVLCDSKKIALTTDPFLYRFVYMALVMVSTPL